MTLVKQLADKCFLKQKETNPDDYPLPPPKKAANELKKLAAKTVKAWYDKFGKDYRLLELGYNYLKDCKKVIQIYVIEKALKLPRIVGY